MRKRIIEFLNAKGLAISIGLFLFNLVLIVLMINVEDVPDSAQFVLMASLLLFCISVLALSLVSTQNAARVFFIMMGFMLFSFIGFQLHMPGSGPIFVLTMLITALSGLFQALSTPFRFKGNNFLRSIGSFALLVIAVGFTLVLFKIQRWPGGDLLLLYAAPTYVVLTFGIVIGIQLTDFDRWEPTQRTFLMRNILVPWAVLFVIGGSLKLFPDQFYKAVRGSGISWGMVKYELTSVKDLSEPELQ